MAHSRVSNGRPLRIQEVEDLFAITDWRVILLDPRIKQAYTRFPPVAMFKALALPFLINIPSERALARELKEREPLAALCGFIHGKTPTRAIFWHFRHRPPGLYPNLMLRLLTAFVLSGYKPNLGLPFVIVAPAGGGEPEGEHLSFSVGPHGPPIEVWRTVPCAIPTRGRTIQELYPQVLGAGRCAPEKGLTSALGLPCEVRAQLHKDEAVRFGIDRPRWLDFRLRKSDTLTRVGPASHRAYDVCLVLITRNGGRQVLLSQRRAGYGRGTYSLPGGKRRPDESLRECAEREVRHEVGIKILRSRPISIYSNRLPGKPRVLNVGVLAEEHEGEPRLLEPDQHTEWKWFDLDDLPVPLFPPARFAILHYVNETYPGLQWEDIEHLEPEHQAKQLELPW